MKNILGKLFDRVKGKQHGEQYKQRVMRETADVDFSAITHDWDKAKRLYDSLKKKCHPDLYVGERNEEATRIFQRLMQSKYDYAELLKLKEEAKEKLGFSEP